MAVLSYIAQLVRRWLLRVTLIVLAVALVFVLLTMTGPGLRIVEAGIRSVTAMSGKPVEVSGISDLWSGETSIKHLRLTDGEGKPWLQITDAALSWSPRALLSGRFEASSVQAARVEIAHLPKGDSGGSSFQLPIGLAIENIALPEILLGETIAGSVSRISLNGKIDAAPGLPVDADFTVKRIDGKDGSLTGTITLNPVTNELAANINAKEPEDGIMANLLRIAGRPALSVDIKGDGPLDNWKGQVNASSGTGKVVLDARIRELPDARAIEISGAGNFGALVPEQASFLLPGESEVNVSATLDKELTGINLKQAVIESSAMRLSVDGTLSKVGANDFTLTLESLTKPLMATLGNAAAPVSVSLQDLRLGVKGAASSAAITFNARVPRVSSADLLVETLNLDGSSPSFDLSTRSGTVALSFAAEAAGTVNKIAARALAGKIAGKIDGSISSGTSLSLTAIDVSSETVRANGTAAVDLSSGSLEAQLSAAIQRAVFPAAAAAVLSDEVTLKTSLARGSDGAIKIEGFDARSGGVSINGNASRATDGQLQAVVDYVIGDIAKANANISGSASGKLEVSGTSAAPLLALTLDSKALTVASLTLENAQLRADAKTAPAPEGALNFTATINGAPAMAELKLGGADGRYSLKNIVVSHCKNQVSGDLDISPTFVPTGKLAIQLQDIGAIGEVINRPLAGSAVGTIDLSSKDGEPQAALDLTSSNISAFGALVDQLRVKGDVANYLAKPAVAGTVRAASARIGKTQLSDIAVTASQDSGWTLFDGSAVAQGFPVKAKGRLQTASGETRIELANASTTYKALPITLSAPTKLSVRGTQVRLDNAALGISGGTVIVSGTAGPALDLQATIRSLPLTSLASLAPTIAPSGALNGTVAITGTAGSPTIRFDAQGTGVSTTQTREAGLAGLGIKANGNLQSGLLTLTTSAQDGSGLNVSASGSVNTTSGNALAFNITGGAPLSLLNGRLRQSAMSLDGPLQVSARVSGTPSSPLVSGSASLQGGKFIDGKSGIGISALGADIGFDGSLVTVRKISGNISAGGTVNGQGTISLLPGNATDLAINIDNGRFADGRIINTRYQARLKLTGGLSSGLTMGGQVDLARTLINVPEASPANITNLDVKHKNASKLVLQQSRRLKDAASVSTAGGGLALDVNVSAPNQIFVRGRGLDVVLGGDLKLTGTTRSPQTQGGFKLLRGRMEFIGRRLDCTDGTISFRGSLIPWLDLKTTSTVNSIAITLTVTGSAANPEITFSSVPALPQDELLAQLIFGRSISKMSALQIASLASSLSKLGGLPQAPDIIGKLRAASGLDDVDVKSDETTGDTSVSIGKRLNNRTYLSLEKGESAGSGKARIDLDIGKGVKLSGQATDSGATKGGIFFEKEY
jgi:translocation and assembly module TamB